LRSAGARVVKVEGANRPDGARFGPPSFFALMNDGKEQLVVDLRTTAGIGELRDLLCAADVVIEASRPRALEQLGLDARSLVEESAARAWVAITGYGQSPPEREWVAFGDDAAAAGGLVVWDDEGPCFCADAVADPLAGLLAATAASIVLAAGGCRLVDVALARTAAAVAVAVPGAA
jgi:crotonobetainyl-CoA:carnitine CoA-transferase CaiB-like acyl-CoA transferase